MSFIAGAILGSAAIGAGASIFGGYEQSKASQAAAGTIGQSMKDAIAAEQGFVGQGTSAIERILGPYFGIAKGGGGGGVLKTLEGLLTPGRSMTDTLSQIPGFKFAQDWGQRGVTAQATTRGLGGNALTGGAQYATGLAQQGYGSIVDRLQALLGTGASAAGAAAGGIGSLFGGAGKTISDILTGGGANIAQTQIGQGNALAGAGTGVAGALSGGASGLANLAILKTLQGGGGGGMYGAPSWGG